MNLQTNTIESVNKYVTFYFAVTVILIEVLNICRQVFNVLKNLHFEFLDCIYNSSFH